MEEEKMTPEKVKEHINNIIKNTYAVLKDVYENQKEGYNRHPEGKNSRIIFPHYSKTYRNKETRLSEQELRFIFVEQFNLYCKDKLDWFYSVETPTEEKYVFSEDGKELKNPRKANAGVDKGQSAMFDLAIHNKKLERIALIEFKALNPDEVCFTKDFLKLKVEGSEEVPTFFVMYVKSYKNSSTRPRYKYDTICSLSKKINTEDRDESTNSFYCYVLEPQKGQKERIDELIISEKDIN